MKKLPWILVVILSVALMFSINKNVQLTNYSNVYTDTLTVRDTIPYPVPVPRDSVVLCYRYVTIPTTPETPDSTKTENKQPEIQVVESTPDSTKLSIPITQRKYETESFTAWVSGYNPQLDSCWVYPKTTTITKVQRLNTGRWGLGVQVGMGVCGNKVSPYIGVGVSYNLFTW